MSSYPFQDIEARAQKKWREMGLFKTPEHPRRKLYILEMFAYPSGDIHMGHFRNYTIGDVITRYRMMQGYEILHPFGWDAFGLPAEEAAIKRGIHPRTWTLNNIEVSRSTLKRMGISYDWDREVITCMPDYYKWTQWIFLRLYHRGLAYQAEAPVNWCPHCQTVLANEQVIEEGVCWRCKTPVTKRVLKQWFFKITAYAERLLKDIDRLEGWPEQVRIMQRNWIGRSEGAEIDFTLEDTGEKFSVFTTRPDTIYGVTFMAISPEHPWANQLAKGTRYEKAVEAYVEKALKKSEIERTAAVGEKDGVFTGKYAINPFSGERVQIWVADYVLPFYGTGIVMGVPAHDERDFQFARRYDIPIKVVIQPDGAALDPETMDKAYVEPGVMVNSGPFSGLPSEEGIYRVTEFAQEKGIGRAKVNYRLRDWLISRQRYWGAPIPMIHCDSCGIVPVPEKDLPVLLPEGNIDFIPKGRSPLADVPKFMQTTCPQCGRKALRDPDTMDTFVCSSWYHLRYLDPRNPHEPFSRESGKTWFPIDLYIGGIEHATGHLLYFRFITKVLYDEGWLPVDEPALRLFNQGMVLDAKGEVMSKSKGNVVSPVHLMDQYGVDVPRIAMLFAAPSDKDIRWTEEGVRGAQRFITRIYAMYRRNQEQLRQIPPVDRIDMRELSEAEVRLYRALHRTIQRVSHDIETMEFNTAIAALMELLNLYDDTPIESKAFLKYFHWQFARLLAPFAPHLAEELWTMVGGDTPSIFRSSWVAFDPEAIAEEMVELVIQVNGKVRARETIPANLPEEEVNQRALSHERIQRYLSGREVRKIINVRNRLVNIVVG